MNKLLTRSAASFLALLLFSSVSMAEEISLEPYTQHFRSSHTSEGSFSTPSIRKKKKKKKKFNGLRASGTARGVKAKPKGNVTCNIPADYAFFLELAAGRKAKGTFNNVAVKGPASAKAFNVKGPFSLNDGVTRNIRVRGKIRSNTLKLTIIEKAILKGVGSCTFTSVAELVKQ